MSKLRARLGDFRFTVALGIVLASVLAATMAWRAAATNELYANTDEQARQQYVERQQLESGLAQEVTQDLRVFARYESLVLEAARLERDARGADGTEAAELTEEASANRAEAEVLESFFFYVPRLLGNGMGVRYQLAQSESTLRSTNAELDELRPEELREEAHSAGIRAVHLTGLAALFIGAVFLFTIAETTRGTVSRMLAGGGALVIVLAGGLFFVVVI